MAATPIPTTSTTTTGNPTATTPARTRLRTRTTRPTTTRFVRLAARFARCQYALVHASADVAASAEWALDGSPTAAHWIAAVTDVEVCTAREWIRIGRHVRALPLVDDRFRNGRLSYSKVRTITRLATPDNEAELVALAERHPAGALTKVLARWMLDHSQPGEIDALHQRSRSATWRNEPDGMVDFRLRLPPHVAAALVAVLQTTVMRTRPAREPDGSWPTLGQQYADAVERHITQPAGGLATEVVFHVRADGCSADDGTPIPDTVMERLVDGAFLRALIHDADARPINASARRRYATTRQRRVVRERDRACRDCGSTALLEFDHVPPYEVTGHTVVDELELRCAPCHRRRHAIPT